MAALRATSILEDRIGQTRNRRSTTGSFFKAVLGGAFATWLQSRPAKSTLQQNQESIKESYDKIHEIIDMVDQHIASRLQRYEEELYGVVKDEVDSMKTQLKKAVEQLNSKIEEKDANGQIWKLNNELDYFRSESFKLFQANKNYRVQLKMLKKKVEGYRSQMQTLDGVIHKITKKLIKRNTSNKKHKQGSVNKLIKGEESTFRSKKNSHQPTQRISFRSDHVQQQIQDAQCDRSFIDIRLSNIERDHIAKPFFDQQPQVEPFNTQDIRLSVPSQKSQLPEMPKARIQLVDSYNINSSYRSKISVKKMVDQAVQTSEETKRVSFNQTATKNLVSSPGVVALFVKKNKKCITQRQIQIQTREERQGRLRDWLKESSNYRIVNSSKKQSKSIMYMSSVIGKNKLSPGRGFNSGGKMLATHYN